jgi:hypothetical protein
MEDGLHRETFPFPFKRESRLGEMEKERIT